MGFGGNNGLGGNQERGNNGLGGHQDHWFGGRQDGGNQNSGFGGHHDSGNVGFGGHQDKGNNKVAEPGSARPSLGAMNVPDDEE